MQLFSEEMRRDPYPFYAQMRRQAPVIGDPRGTMWMAFDYDDVKQILADTDTFSSSVAPPNSKPLDWIVFADPPRHTQLRNIFTRAFMPKSVGGFEPRIREISRMLLDRQRARGEMDLVEAYSGPFPSMVIADIIGIPNRDQASFLGWNDLLQTLSAAVLGNSVNYRQLSQYAAIQERMSAYLRELIAHRRRAPLDDLLTRLTLAEADGERLSESEIMGFIQLLFSAATETSTNLIGNAVLTLLEYPEQLELLRARPELIPGAVEELLRFRAPIQTLIRQTRREVELRGQHIPAGKFVFAVLGAANRDPKVFAQPDVFEIQRDPNPHLAFGYGAHYCMGLHLGKLEARVALEDLLTLGRIQRKSLEPWKPQPAQHVLGPAHLPIRFG